VREREIRREEVSGETKGERERERITEPEKK
jgi:hypothetical protein